ncbi:MAG: HD domain-containing protein [Patescibacteria group bacterium]
MKNIEIDSIFKINESIKIDEIMKGLPEVRAERDLWQNDFHQFTVYGHTKKFVMHLKNILENERQKKEFDFLNLVAAGWLHDIGKPITAKPKEKDGKILERKSDKPYKKIYHKFLNHEIEGEKRVREMNPEIFKELGLNQEKVALLVGCHFLPMKGIKDVRKAKDLNEFLQKYNDLKERLEKLSESNNGLISKEEILLMFLADKLGQGDPEKYVTDQEELFSIRNALLLKDKMQEEQKLKEIYNFQKVEAEKNKEYAIKE